MDCPTFDTGISTVITVLCIQYSLTRKQEDCVHAILGFKQDSAWVTDSVTGFLKPLNDELNFVSSRRWLPSLTTLRQPSYQSVEANPLPGGYNWTTLFLGDINTGTWPSRLGKSQMRQ
jgi:hypothetical protein